MVSDPNLDCFAKFERGSDPECVNNPNSDKCTHLTWKIKVPSGNFDVTIEVFDN